MIHYLNTWKGSIEVDGVVYASYNALQDANTHFSNDVCIKLHPTQETRLKIDSSASQSDSCRVDSTASNNNVANVSDESVYLITVRQYMTKKASPEFDFMAKYNNNVPMPMRTMVGTIEKETRGMVYAHLKGMGLKTITCMRCGRELTNPVSRHYGIGPECMEKLGFSADISDIDFIKEKLSEVEWSGWIIKSAITAKEEVNKDGNMA